MSEITRFAPSPTGYLHIGHALAALYAAKAAGYGGTFHLRMDDLDRHRAHPHFEAAIVEDMEWLGIMPKGSVYKQSDHLHLYHNALDTLTALGVLYPCFCTRADIRREQAAIQSAPHLEPAAGNNGGTAQIYPGICKKLSQSQHQQKIAARIPYALRLDVKKAKAITGRLYWQDRTRGHIMATPEILGDIVLARKDLGVAYHLAVVIDDTQQGITLVTRGADLFDATHMHRLLIALLKLPVPTWDHHRLVADEKGARLAKRSASFSLGSWRAEGRTLADLRGFLDI